MQNIMQSYMQVLYVSQGVCKSAWGKPGTYAEKKAIKECQTHLIITPGSEYLIWKYLLEQLQLSLFPLLPRHLLTFEGSGLIGY